MRETAVSLPGSAGLSGGGAWTVLGRLASQLRPGGGPEAWGAGWWPLVIGDAHGS